VNYRLTCLTPVLIGDGRELAPIDYMVWKDQVNILDQNRIFKLLARGPRLENYLAQLKRADKLDFASWGGFAQNFAGRRIPFEHPSCTPIWEKARAEHLFIPLFASGQRGPYVPGSALKGALRTGLLFQRWSPELFKDLAERLRDERPPRHPGEAADERLLGSPANSRMKAVSAADSKPAPEAAMKVYLLRTTTLQAKAGRLELGWKQTPRGAVDGSRPEESTPMFAEMATPGTVFEGRWSEREFFRNTEILRVLHWKEPSGTVALVKASNAFADSLLSHHLRYFEAVGLGKVKECVAGLLDRVRSLADSTNACVVPVGWGCGILSKSGWVDTAAPPYREMMRHVAMYSKAIQSGLPFPKTRRIVFLNNQPAALPGWALVEFA
jgi:CRISPR-associated protein Csm5